MTAGFLTSISAAAMAGMTLFATPAISQTNMSEWAAAASSDVNMHSDYAMSLAKSAYVWAYPMVNMVNRRNAFAQVPAPGKVFGVLPGAPTNRIGMLNDYINPGKNFIACPNQDVVYGLGFMDLSKSS